MSPDPSEKRTPPDLRRLLAVFVVLPLVLFPLAQSLRQTYEPNYLLGMSSAFWAGICLGLSGMSVLIAVKLLLAILADRKH